MITEGKPIDLNVEELKRAMKEVKDWKVSIVQSVVDTVGIKVMVGKFLSPGTVVLLVSEDIYNEIRKLKKERNGE